MYYKQEYRVNNEIKGNFSEEEIYQRMCAELVRQIPIEDLKKLFTLEKEDINYRPEGRYIHYTAKIDIPACPR